MTTEKDAPREGASTQSEHGIVSPANSVHVAFDLPIRITIEIGTPVRNDENSHRANGSSEAVVTGASGRATYENQAANDVDGMPILDELAPVLEGWRAQQRQGRIQNKVSFVLNFSDRRPSDSDLGASLSKILKLRVTVVPLFDPKSGLERFRKMVIDGVSRVDRADLFDIARAVREISGAMSVDPDLGTEFYTADLPPKAPVPNIGPESTDFAFWCWADEKDIPRDVDWAIKTTGIEAAWQYSEVKGKRSRGEGVVIFQPDTGVVASHGELGSNLHKVTGAVNFVEGGHGALDPMIGGRNLGHGTSVASVIISAEDGEMRGVAPMATLVPVRCITSVAVFDQSPVAQAIDHARLSGAHIISLSLGGVFSEALHAALRQAVAANIIVVAAAGNCVGEVVWPARFPEVIAVGGVNAEGKPWRGSSYGSSVAVSGPAEFVLRADARVEGYPNAVTSGQGTSFATAHLAGVAALWLAHHGRENLIGKLPARRYLQDMFRGVVRASASVPAGFDTGRYGAGIVNAAAMIRLEPDEAITIHGAPASAGILDQVTTLLDRVFGGGASEAAAPAFMDPQNYAELAVAAFERLRADGSRNAAHEAMPPVHLSAGLRDAMRSRGVDLAQFGPVKEHHHG